MYVCVCVDKRERERARQVKNRASRDVRSRCARWPSNHNNMSEIPISRYRPCRKRICLCFIVVSSFDAVVFLVNLRIYNFIFFSCSNSQATNWNRSSSDKKGGSFRGLFSMVFGGDCVWWQRSSKIYWKQKWLRPIHTHKQHPNHTMGRRYIVSRYPEITHRRLFCVKDLKSWPIVIPGWFVVCVWRNRFRIRDQLLLWVKACYTDNTACYIVGNVNWGNHVYLCLREIYYVMSLIAAPDLARSYLFIGNV